MKRTRTHVHRQDTDRERKSDGGAIQQDHRCSKQEECRTNRASNQLQRTVVLTVRYPYSNRTRSYEICTAGRTADVGSYSCVKQQCFVVGLLHDFAEVLNFQFSRLGVFYLLVVKVPYLDNKIPYLPDAPVFPSWVFTGVSIPKIIVSIL